MKVSALLSAVLLSLALISVGYPSLTVYNFDAVATGTYTEAQLSALCPGVSFDNTGGDGFEVSSVSLSPDFSLPNAVLNQPYWTTGNSTIARFSSLTNFVSVTMGDYNADDDNLYLKAYDAGDNLVGSDFYANPSSSSAGYTLSVSSALSNIAWAEFYAVGVSNNSVYWDNFSFEGGATIPAPGALLLGSIGVSIVGWLRRRKTL